MVNEFKQSEQVDSFIQSFGRIQSQIELLMELEKSWSDKLTTDQLQELINSKQQLINNIQSLINNQKSIEAAFTNTEQGQLPKQYQSYRDEQISDIRQKLEAVLSLHNRHEQELKNKADDVKSAVEEVEQALQLINTYQSQSKQQGLRIDLAG